MSESTTMCPACEAVDPDCLFCLGKGSLLDSSADLYERMCDELPTPPTSWFDSVDERARLARVARCPHRRSQVEDRSIEEDHDGIARPVSWLSCVDCGTSMGTR